MKTAKNIFPLLLTTALFVLLAGFIYQAYSLGRLGGSGVFVRDPNDNSCPTCCGGAGGGHGGGGPPGRNGSGSPGQGWSGAGSDSCSSCNNSNVSVSGMPMWKVSEPYISLWLQDEPLGYQPAVGPRLSFLLSYKQREEKAGFDPNGIIHFYDKLTVMEKKGHSENWPEFLLTHPLTKSRVEKAKKIIDTKDFRYGQ